MSSGQLCQWQGCDQIRRQKWSLINHLQEKHCNENSLKTALLNRQRGCSTDKPGSNANAKVVAPPNVNAAASLNSKDAALISINVNNVSTKIYFFKNNSL